MTTKKVYNLNVSDRYVPGWGPWEVVREIVTNAMDADASWDLTRVGVNNIKIFTSTVPRLGDMIVIGQGTKDRSDDNIGQFGEGLKLAALTACRSGGYMTITTTEGILWFFLKDMPEFDAKVLHCEFDSSGRTTQHGCYVDIEMEGIGDAGDGRFLKDVTQFAISPKQNNAYITFYVKGVFIKQFDQFGLYDWNLKNSCINRDRSMIDMGQVEVEVCYHITSHITEVSAMEILENQDSFECHTLSHCFFPSPTVWKPFVKAFHQKYGQDAIIASSTTRHNEYAMLKGFKVIFIPEAGLERMLRNGIETAEEKIPKDADVDVLKRLRMHDYRSPMIDNMHRLFERLHIPARVVVFRVDPDVENVRGHVSASAVDSNLIVWIREDTVRGGPRAFYDSALSYVAIACTQFPDISMSFEGSLSSMCAALADAWINDTEK